MTAAARIVAAKKRGLKRLEQIQSAKYVPVGHVKTVAVDTPRGFVGNALAVSERCGGVDDLLVLPATCPAASRVGGILLGFPELAVSQPIYTVEPEFGVPAQFAFNDTLGGIYVFAPPHARR